LAAAIVAAVAVLLTRQSGHAASVSRSRCGAQTCYFFPGAGRIVFGMTPHEVQRALGKPATKQGRCWQYPHPVDKYLAAYGVVKSVMGACFFGGALSETRDQNYVRRHGKLVLWDPPRPKLP
jgi:hypothetical protein